MSMNILIFEKENLFTLWNLIISRNINIYNQKGIIISFEILTRSK